MTRPAWTKDLRYTPHDTWEPTDYPHRWRVKGSSDGPTQIIDLLWDALIGVLGWEEASLTTSGRGEVNRAVAELRAVNADPREVRLRAGRYRSGQGSVPRGTTLTPSALVKHWAGCATPPPVTEQEHEACEHSEMEHSPAEWWRPVGKVLGMLTPSLKEQHSEFGEVFSRSAYVTAAMRRVRNTRRSTHMSQRDRILALLKQGPVCASRLLDKRIPRYSARIYELRRAGYLITTRRCQRPDHYHRSKQVEFVLQYGRRGWRDA